MKKNAKLTLLGHIEQIVELSLNSGLKDDFFEKAKPHLNHVKRVLHLNDIQVVFLSHFMDKSPVRMRKGPLIVNLHRNPRARFGISQSVMMLF
jgi:hypothetical protein